MAGRDHQSVYGDGAASHERDEASPLRRVIQPEQVSVVIMGSGVLSESKLVSVCRG
jgi:hypothetical protein